MATALPSPAENSWAPRCRNSGATDIALSERIRNVRQGPDGWIYLLTGSRKLIRIER